MAHITDVLKKPVLTEKLTCRPKDEVDLFHIGNIDIGKQFVEFPQFFLSLLGSIPIANLLIQLNSLLQSVLLVSIWCPQTQILKNKLIPNRHIWIDGCQQLAAE